tara:strand:+ start:665 stop:904 length:240 start_codon:yes stop_codon:yes gene_type:complete
MVDRIPTEIQTVDNTIYTILEATVTTGDTITVNGIKTIARVVIGQLLGGTDVSASTSTNVITITESSLTNQEVVMIVWE